MTLPAQQEDPAHRFGRDVACSWTYPAYTPGSKRTDVGSGEPSCPGGFACSRGVAVRAMRKTVSEIITALGLAPPLAVAHPKVVQATGCLHDRIGSLIRGVAQHVLDGAAPLSARQRVLHPHPDATELAVPALLRRGQFPAARLFFAW